MLSEGQQKHLSFSGKMEHFPEEYRIGVESLRIKKSFGRETLKEE